METRRLTLWQGKVTTDVEVSGSGPALVYLHGPWGLPPDRAFVARLAEHHTVYAPQHPGTAAGHPNDVHAIDSFWDLTIYYCEMFDRLGLEKPILAGHSFGGLVAAEIAATVPGRMGKLVLIDPVGLWRDDMPVRNWMLLPENERARTFFADPDGVAAKTFFDIPQDAEGRVATLVAFVWAQAATGKFVWPIPDKGLKKHLHRIANPTLVIWGEQDRIINPAYADMFASGITGAKIAMVSNAGHLPQLEQPEKVIEEIEDFLR